MALSETQYSEIISMYNKTQTQNRSIEQMRKEEVYNAIPRIKEIDQEIATSSIHAVRTRLMGQADTMDATKEQNHSLIDEKTKLLESHGYPKDYLQPIYTCPICKDSGYVNNTYCSCFKQTAISFLYQQSTLDQILEKENFDNFDLSYYPKEADNKHPYTSYDNMNNILEKTKYFVEKFDNNGGNLLFYGETGLGKTFLSNCIAKALLDTQHTVLYQTAIHLFEDVCGDVLMRKNNNPDNKRIYDFLFDCDLLIIDDLGTEFTNSFVSSELYDILNTRIRTGKSTVISTNLNLQELTDRYSDRTSTRIFADYKVFNFYGKNIRLAKRRNEITQ